MSTVRRALRGAGVHLRDDRTGHTGGQNKVTLTPTQSRQVVEAYLAGDSIKVITRRHGWGRDIVRRTLLQEGVTIRPPTNTAWRQTTTQPTQVDPPPHDTEPPAQAQPTTAAHQPAHDPAGLAAELVALANDLAAFVGRIRRIASMAEEAS